MFHCGALLFENIAFEHFPSADQRLLFRLMGFDLLEVLQRSNKLFTLSVFNELHKWYNPAFGQFSMWEKFTIIISLLNFFKVYSSAVGIDRTYVLKIHNLPCHYVHCNALYHWNTRPLPRPASMTPMQDAVFRCRSNFLVKHVSVRSILWHHHDVCYILVEVSSFYMTPGVYKNACYLKEFSLTACRSCDKENAHTYVPLNSCMYLQKLYIFIELLYMKIDAPFGLLLCSRPPDISKISCV